MYVFITVTGAIPFLLLRARLIKFIYVTANLLVCCLFVFFFIALYDLITIYLAS